MTEEQAELIDMLIMNHLRMYFPPDANPTNAIIKRYEDNIAEIKKQLVESTIDKDTKE